MRRASKAIIAVALVLGVTLVQGCVWRGPEIDKKAMIKQAVAFMENRYGVEFAYSGIQGGGIDGTNMSRPVLYLSTSYIPDPNVRIKLQAEPNNGEFTFSNDNFLYYKFAQDAQDQAMPVVGAVLGRSTVRVKVEMFGNMSYPDSFTAGTTGEEFFRFFRRHAAEHDSFSGGQPLAEFRVLAVDEGKDLENVAEQIIPVLVQATGWGLSGRFEVPCSLRIETYSVDGYQAWVKFLGKRDSVKNPTPRVDPIDEVSVEF